MVLDRNYSSVDQILKWHAQVPVESRKKIEELQVRPSSSSPPVATLLPPSPVFPLAQVLPSFPPRRPCLVATSPIRGLAMAFSS